jgi:hypothetical protein
VQLLKDRSIDALLGRAARWYIAVTGAAPYPAAMPITYEFHPAEVESYIKPLPPREQLVYRLAIRGLCQRCVGYSGSAPTP